MRAVSGLYHGDTRMISCSVMRLGGVRPVLLQGSMGGNYRGRIQLTNPSADRNPDAKVHPLDELVGRTIGISRDRMIGSGALEERVRIMNHASQPLRLSLELELGADGADIFEVRGYPRERRGHPPPGGGDHGPGDVPVRRPRRETPIDPCRVLAAGDRRVGRRRHKRRGRRRGRRGAALGSRARAGSAVTLRWTSGRPSTRPCQRGEDRGLDEPADCRALPRPAGRDQRRGRRPPTTRGSAARRPSRATTTCSTSS